MRPFVVNAAFGNRLCMLCIFIGERVDTFDMYDTIIVGAGIAGLHAGIECLKRNPATKCLLLEKNQYLGGRVYTFHTSLPGRGPFRWEAGAGRIAANHRGVRSLMKRYGLTFLPLQGEWDTAFTQWADLYLPPLQQLSPSLLGEHTLSEILQKVYGAETARTFMTSFPYYAEFHILRADLALQALQGELHSSKGFGVCKEGLDTLIRHMVEDFQQRGGIIEQGALVESIQWKPHLCVQGTKEEIPFVYDPTTLILAVTVTALQRIHGPHRFPFLRHLKMIPLLRIYAVFPVRKGQSWFSDQRTTVMDSPIRFFIPIRPDQGVAMISYTEGADAQRWMEEPESTKKRTLMKELRKAFPDSAIPDPLFIKEHLWKEGCSYWTPGPYDPVKESETSIQPIKDARLFLCNESFATIQCWMESSLIQADRVLQRLRQLDSH